MNRARGTDARTEAEMTHRQHKAPQDTAAGRRAWRCLSACLLVGTLLLPSPSGLAAEFTLGDALQRALANQALVQQAERVVAEKAALHRAAHADLLPSLSLAAGSIWTQTRNGRPLFVSANGAREVIGQIQLNIPLYAPQAYALQALAHNQLAVARYQERQARLLVAAQVTAAYYRLALWENEKSVWREALGAARELLSATQKSFQAGTRSRLDLTQARLTLAGVQAGLDQATPEAAAARRVLALQTDYPASELPALVPISPPAGGLPGETVLTTQASQAQPLLQVAEGEIQAARTLLRYHQAARLPVVGAMGAYGVDTTTVPQSRDLGWQGALTLQMPIFGFGRNRDRIAAAQEHLAAMEAGKRALLLQVQSRIAADYGAAQAADNALRNDRTMAQEAQAVYEMTRKGYLAGALSALALQQAENNWVQARLKLAGAAIRARLARAQLALDSGVLPKSEEQS